MSRYFDDFNTNDEILHYGVKGMKWRKRLKSRIVSSANKNLKNASYHDTQAGLNRKQSYEEGMQAHRSLRKASNNYNSLDPQLVDSTSKRIGKGFGRRGVALVDKQSHANIAEKHIKNKQQHDEAADRHNKKAEKERKKAKTKMTLAKIIGGR